jgi:cysteine-rich repeat protein
MHLQSSYLPPTVPDMRRPGLLLALAACVPGTGTNSTQVDLDTCRPPRCHQRQSALQTVTRDDVDPDPGATDPVTSPRPRRTPAAAPQPDDSSSTGDDASSTGAIEPVCGNGEVEPGEECDDGNRDETDGVHHRVPPARLRRRHPPARRAVRRRQPRRQRRVHQQLPARRLRRRQGRPRRRRSATTATPSTPTPAAELQARHLRRRRGLGRQRGLRRRLQRRRLQRLRPGCKARRPPSTAATARSRSLRALRRRRPAWPASAASNDLPLRLLDRPADVLQPDLQLGRPQRLRPGRRRRLLQAAHRQPRRPRRPSSRPGPADRPRRLPLLRPQGLLPGTRTCGINLGQLPEFGVSKDVRYQPTKIKSTHGSMVNVIQASSLTCTP